VRCILSIVLYGIFGLVSYRHHDSVQLPPLLYYLGMSALCYLFLYITEHSSSKGEERLGIIGSYFFLVIAALGSASYLFGWEHVVPRDVVHKLF
jgi:hypothetical protein